MLKNLFMGKSDLNKELTKIKNSDIIYGYLSRDDHRQNWRSFDGLLKAMEISLFRDMLKEFTSEKHSAPYDLKIVEKGKIVENRGFECLNDLYFFVAKNKVDFPHLTFNL